MTSDRGLLARADLSDGLTVSVLSGDAVDADLRDRMLALLRSSFGESWPGFGIVCGQAEHLQWKLDGPFEDAPSYVSLVHDDDRLVGMSVKLREQARLGRVELTLQGGGDGCTHPDYQGRGIYRERKDFERETIEAWFDCSLTTAGDVHVLRDRARRYDEMSPINEPRVFMRVNSAIACAKALRLEGSRWPWPMLAVPLTLVHLAEALQVMRGCAITHTHVITEVVRFDHRVDKLFDECADQFEFIQVRSAEFLNWRYADIRGGAYRVFAAEDNGELLGYVALKVDGPRCYVMDLIVRPSRLDVVDSLLLQTRRVATDADAAVTICWLPRQHPYRKMLRRNGFISTRRRTGLAIVNFASPGGVLAGYLHRRMNLHVMIGDTDSA